MDVPVSPEINGILDAAAAVCTRQGQYYVGVEHIFEVLVERTNLLPTSAQEDLQSLQMLLSEVQRTAWRGRLNTHSVDLFYTPRCANLTHQAGRLASQLRSSTISAGHLLLAIFMDPLSAPSRAMERLGFDRGTMVVNLRNDLLRANGEVPPSTPVMPAVSAEQSASHVAPSVSVTAPVQETTSESPSKVSASVLGRVTRDLTQAAADGRIDPAIGRDKEQMQVVEILTRKNKNNVMLVGGAGVGKTKIVEGLAVLAAQGKLANLLPNARIVELNVAALMSGTQYRGAFEEKIISLLDELKRDPHAILFIDEAHLIMGAGGTDDSTIDLANLLKPALARGEIRCIGATTLDEYRKFVEKDPAIDRRFQLVRVEELSPDDTYQLLDAMRPSLQKHHGVRISHRAMRTAVHLTQRYLPQRKLPDKAIDVLDQTCARYRLQAVLCKQRDPSFTIPNHRRKVLPHDVRKVVSDIAGVPLEEITAAERLRLGNLEDLLKRKLIGQDEAVSRVAAMVRKSRAGLASPNRPAGVLLFVGPSGVGKTQLAKALASLLFGDRDHLVTFDMSEYVESHSVSRLLGAPPGYVGSEEEGRLTGAIREKPFSILLFDEIEKAHRQIFDIFLPLFDEGRIKDQRGRDADFRHCYIILTSNIGAEILQNGHGEEQRTAVMEELRKHFRPEFINRINDIVPFRPLLFEDVRSILMLALDDLRERLAEKDISLKVYQRAYEHLAREGYSVEYGARELNRTVERLVADPLTDLVVNGTIDSGDTVEVFMQDKTLHIEKAPAVIPDEEYEV